MIFSWIINIAANVYVAEEWGESIQEGEIAHETAVGLYAEQDAPYCARESRGKDMRRERKKKKKQT